MTYRRIKEFLDKMTPEQLAMDVMLYDIENDCYPEAINIFNIDEEEDQMDRAARDGLMMEEGQVIISF